MTGTVFLPVRKILFAAILMASCSKGPEADLASIGEARSISAEWALLNEQALQGHLNATYANTMRNAFRQQLESIAGSLTQPASAYGAEIRVLLRMPGDAPPGELRAHAARLKQIEDQLESA